MSLVRTVIAFVLIAAAGCGGGNGFPCNGPQECGGNACCVTTQIRYGSDSAIACTASPAACAPLETADYTQTRLCRTDADCTAGAIQTWATVCCRASLLSQEAHACTGASRCFNTSSTAQR